MNKKIASVCVALFLIVVIFTCGCVEEEKVKEEKIIIDGDGSDWHKLEIQPILTSNDDSNISDEADIKALYLSTDGEKIYAMMELYDNVSVTDYTYGISLRPNRTVWLEFDDTLLSVQMECGDCGLDCRYGGSSLYFNSSCAARGKNIEFAWEGTSGFIASGAWLFSDKSDDVKPLTPYTLVTDKKTRFDRDGVKLTCYSAIDKKPIDRIVKYIPKTSDIITKI